MQYLIENVPGLNALIEIQTDNNSLTHHIIFPEEYYPISVKTRSTAL